MIIFPVYALLTVEKRSETKTSRQMSESHLVRGRETHLSIGKHPGKQRSSSVVIPALVTA